MIFGKDRNISATRCLIVICTAVYLLDKYIISSDSESLVISIGNVVLDSTTIWGKILGFCGGSVFTALAYNTDLFLSGELWRPITSILVHLFIIHFVVNMLALWIVGPKVEKLIGSKHFIFLFFVLGIADLFLTNLLFLDERATLLSGGASGAIFSIMGYSFLHQISHRYNKRIIYKKAEIAYLAFYGVFFSYIFADSWTACAHTIAFLLGVTTYLSIPLLQRAKSFCTH